MNNKLSSYKKIKRHFRTLWPFACKQVGLQYLESTQPFFCTKDLCAKNSEGFRTKVIAQNTLCPQMADNGDRRSQTNSIIWSQHFHDGIKRPPLSFPFLSNKKKGHFLARTYFYFRNVA